MKHLFAPIVVVVLGTLMASGVDARNLDGRWNNAANKEWYSSQHTATGLWCCDMSDAEPFAGGYVLNADGSVTLDNGTHIEKEKVLTTPNPTGSAVWWHVRDHTYCFAIGPLM